MVGPQERNCFRGLFFVSVAQNTGGDMTETLGVMNHREAAAYIGVTPNTMRVWCSKKRVPFCKLGARKVVFRKNDLDKFLDSRVVEVQA